MGTGYSVIYDRCKKEFIANYGDGMSFILLHCDRCGVEKRVRYSGKDMDNLREGLRIPCKCGGSFTMDASPRCPRCGSTEFTINENGFTISYD
jgi:uncharacterized paraquat-inducible protein A